MKVNYYGDESITHRNGRVPLPHYHTQLPSIFSMFVKLKNVINLAYTGADVSSAYVAYK